MYFIIFKLQVAQYAGLKNSFDLLRSFDLHYCPIYISGQLHDAMYSYGIALNRTIADDPSRYRDGLFIVQHMLQSFQGLVH